MVGHGPLELLSPLVCLGVNLSRFVSLPVHHKTASYFVHTCIPRLFRDKSRKDVGRLMGVNDLHTQIPRDGKLESPCLILREGSASEPRIGSPDRPATSACWLCWE
ncbi:unnamed protein product [Scytosiphon promiscuus]